MQHTATRPSALSRFSLDDRPSRGLCLAVLLWLLSFTGRSQCLSQLTMDHFDIGGGYRNCFTTMPNGELVVISGESVFPNTHFSWITRFTAAGDLIAIDSCACPLMVGSGLARADCIALNDSTIVYQSYAYSPEPHQEYYIVTITGDSVGMISVPPDDYQFYFEYFNSGGIGETLNGDLLLVAPTSVSCVNLQGSTNWSTSIISPHFRSSLPAVGCPSTPGGQHSSCRLRAFGYHPHRHL